MYNAKDAETLLSQLKNQVTSRADIVRRLAELCLDWPYVYAAAGEMCTPAWRKNRMGYSDEKYAKAIHDACPSLKGGTCDGCKWNGCRCFDCRGFTRWLLAQVGITLAGGGATTQWETSSNWVAKGEVKDMPKGLVCCVFKRKDAKMSHTGMSMGDGNGGVIHCSTIVKRGNVYTDSSKWTHWGIPAGLYTDAELQAAGVDVKEGSNLQTLRNGSTGEGVKTLQALLNDTMGAGLTVDGIFGAKTETAVKAWQKAHGLTADGVVGAKTRAAMGLIDEDNNVPGKPIEDVTDTNVGNKSSSSDNAARIWNRLLAAIGNPCGVAGIMGNLQAESALNPENLQNTGERALGMSDLEYTQAVDTGAYTAEQFANDGYGYGLAQWTYKTRKAALLRYAHEQEFSIGELDVQVDFLLDELRFDYSSVWYTLLNAASVREASDAVLLKYERPKNMSEENQVARAERGQAFYDRFAATAEQEPDADPIDEDDEEVEAPEGVWVPIKDWRAIRAAFASLSYIMQKYE